MSSEVIINVYRAAARHEPLTRLTVKCVRSSDHATDSSSQERDLLGKERVLVYLLILCLVGVLWTRADGSFGACVATSTSLAHRTHLVMLFVVDSFSL